MNCNLQGNGCLWLLVAALVLGSDALCKIKLSGCTVPFLLALAYCLGKNGTLSSLSGCGD